MATEQGDKPKHIPPEYISRETALVPSPEEEVEPNPEDCRYRLPDDIREAEQEWIDKRRKNFGLDRIPESDGNGGSDNQGGSIAPVDHGDSSGNGERAVAPIHVNLVGLALSGGGIRSATFSLGVMQALAKHDLMKYVDILSTVSGGGYIGSSLTWLTSGQADSRYKFSTKTNDLKDGDLGFPFGTDDPKDDPPDPATLTSSQKILRYLRGHGNYLTPGKGITIFSGIAVLLRGTFLNLLVWLPLMAAAWYLAIDKGVLKYAAILSGVIAALFVLFPIIYSLLTYLRFGSLLGTTRYGWRRRYEKVAGWAIRIFLLAGAIALIPVVHELAGDIEGDLTGTTKLIANILAWGGPGYLLLGLAAGFLGLKKMNQRDGGGLLSKGLLGLAIVLVFWGIIVFTYQIADLVRTGDPEWLVTKLNEWVATLPSPLNGVLDGLIKGGKNVFYVLVFVAVVTGWFVNVNYLSLHRFYRDRLMETFMPDVEGALEDKTVPATRANNAGLSTFRNANGPYHILNTNLILVNSDNKLWKRRHGDNFILSPLYCGGNAVGWRKTDSFIGNHLTMATAVAISGAAANPNSYVGGKGVTINPLVGFLMALLNIRLGTWVPNPRVWQIFQDHLTPNHFWPGLYEVVKLLGGPGYNEKRVFLQLADGGHFENTGIYELIRRRAKLIICCDGGGDPDFTFSDYHDALNRIVTDFGATIDITAAQLGNIVPRTAWRFPTGVKLAKQGYVTGTIHYPNGGSGTLIYLKTTMVDDLSLATLRYRVEHPTFPDETTADQFFSVEQFEAYRELGYAIAIKMVEKADLIEGVGLGVYIRKIVEGQAAEDAVSGARTISS